MYFQDFLVNLEDVLLYVDQMLLIRSTESSKFTSKFFGQSIGNDI